MSTRRAVAGTEGDAPDLIEAAAGRVPGDPYYVARPVSPFDSAATDPASLRAGLNATAATGIDVDARFDRAPENTARRVEDPGHRSQHVDWPTTADLLAAAPGGVGANAASATQVQLAQLVRRLGSGDLEPATAAIEEWVSRASAANCLDVVGAVREAGLPMPHLFSHIDGLVTPATASIPPPLGHVDACDLDRFLVGLGPMASFTALAS